MRSKILLMMLCATLAGATAHADLLDVSVHGGYTTVNMAELNRSNANLWGWDVEGTWTDINSGAVAGVDLTTKRLSPWSWLDLGLRTEFLQTNQALVKMWNSSGYYDDYIATQGTLASALVGGKASAPFLVDGLSLGLGAWIGYGHANLSQYVPIHDNALQSGIFSSSLLQAEAEMNFGYQMTRRISLSASGGWRWADAGTMKDSSGQPLGDNLGLWEFGRLSPINVDFSGLTAEGSIAYSF